MFETQATARQQVVDMFIGPGDDYVYRLPHASSNLFYSGFAGLNVLRAIGDMGAQSSELPHVALPGRELVEAFESLVLDRPLGMQGGLYALLPPKTQVQELADRVSSTILFGHDILVGFEDFPRKLDRLYEVDPEEYGVEDKKFLALIYAVLALGKRCGPSTADDEVDEHSDRVKLKG